MDCGGASNAAHRRSAQPCHPTAKLWLRRRTPHRSILSGWLQSAQIAEINSRGIAPGWVSIREPHIGLIELRLKIGGEAMLRATRILLALLFSLGMVFAQSPPIALSGTLITPDGLVADGGV